MTGDAPDPHAFWAERYAENATPWERDAVNPALAAWAEAGLLEPGLVIAVPGCGRSREVAALARRGLSVIASDLVEETIAWQRAQLDEDGLAAELVVGDALAWRPGEPVDRVYEQTFLCAIHPRLRAEYERAVHAWLKPGGVLLALFMQKAEMGGPPYGCSIEAMRALFPETRWRWPEAATLRVELDDLGLAEAGYALERL